VREELRDLYFVMQKSSFLKVTFLFIVSIFLFCCSKPSKEELQNVANLLNSRQYNSAISKLNELNNKYSDNARVYYYLGYSYLNRKDYNKALKNLQVALELKSNLRWVIGDTTLANFLAGNSTDSKDIFFKTAVKELEKIIDENRGKELADEIRYHLAVLFLIKKDYESSIKELQNVINEDPKSIFDAKAHMKIGDIYINFLDNPEKGIEEYRKVINEYGKNEISAEASLRIAIFLKKRALMYKERYESLKRFLENWKGIKEMAQDIKLAELQSFDDLNRAKEFRLKAESSLKNIIKDYPDNIFQKRAKNELLEIKKGFNEM